jgi:DsbC/DsbD-like thiol-disulfide interchange protein
MSEIAMRLMRGFFLMGVALTSALIIFSAGAHAQPNPIKWTIKAEAPLKADDKFIVQVTARIDKGWHIYSLTQPDGGPIATRITLPDGQPFKLAGTIRGPKPQSKFSEAFGRKIEWHEDTVDFTVPVRAATSIPPGKPNPVVEVRFQACSDRICLPPRTLSLELDKP